MNGTYKGWPTSKFGVDPGDGRTLRAYAIFLREHGTSLSEEVSKLGGLGACVQLLPCAFPGCPNEATYKSTLHARGEGYQPYCEAHRYGREALKPMFCSVPKYPHLVARRSAKAARKNRNKPYCEGHKRGLTFNSRSPCSVPGCQENATSRSSWMARNKGTKPYCEAHKGNKCQHERKAAWGDNTKLLSPCCVPGCHNLATQASSEKARLQGSRAYCDVHRGGPKAVRPLVPCSAEGCTAMATKSSSMTFLWGTTKHAYCEEHKGGLRSRAMMA